MSGADNCTVDSFCYSMLGSHWWMNGVTGLVAVIMIGGLTVMVISLCGPRPPR